LRQFVSSRRQLDTAPHLAQACASVTSLHAL
jgi:hypothetical protein